MCNRAAVKWYKPVFYGFITVQTKSSRLEEAYDGKTPSKRN